MKKNTFILTALGVSLIAFSTGALAAIKFSDVPANHWAAGAIAYVSEAGLMKGYEGKNTFGINDNLTRAQAAVIIQRQNQELEKNLAHLQEQINELKNKNQVSDSSVEEDFLTYRKDFIQLSYPKNYTYVESEGDKKVGVGFENEKKELAFGVEWISTEDLRSTLSDHSSSNEELAKKAMTYYVEAIPIETQEIAGFLAHKSIAKAGCDGPACDPKEFVVFTLYNSSTNKIYLLKFFETKMMEKVLSSVKFNSDPWASISNKDLDFSIQYPKNWAVSEGESFGAYHIFFNNEATEESFGVLPKGELDADLPKTTPVISELIIDGRKAVKKQWEVSDGKILIIVNFSDYPETWNEFNRIHFSGPKTDLADFEAILESLNFID